jgi:RNA polymerase sigma-70 factor (ECF subfamily)
MTEATDKTLIARYRGGDTDALDALVEKYRRPLFGYIINMIGGQDDAEEIFQEVWFRAIRKFDSYRQKNLFGWLVRISRNLVIDRARRRRPSVSLDAERDEGHALAETLPGDDPGPAHGVEMSELDQQVQAAVKQLPEEQREVFIMRVQANVSFKEIARIQKVSINTALARMQYALAKLREKLQDAYAELSRA